MEINQIDLISAITKHISKGRKHVPAIPRQFNTIIKAANMIVDAYAVDHIPAVPGMTLEQWRGSDDVGRSSLYVAYILAGGPEAEYAYPLDADDFGRVYKLWKFVDGMSGIQIVGHTGTEWQRLVDVWDLLTQLYEAGDFKGLSSMIAVELEKAKG